MSQYQTLKTQIQENIKQNGEGAIRGDILQTQLLDMINALGAGYQFMGVATPTNPGSAQTPDYKCFYLATTPGTYTNLGGLVVADGEVAILKWDTAWTKEMTGIATQAKLYELESETRWVSLNSGNGVIFQDRKSTYAPLSLFANGLIVGQKYTVTNLSDVAIGLYAYDKDKQPISPLATGVQPGSSATFTFSVQNATYVGGWGNTLLYKISLKWENPELDDVIADINSLHYSKSDRNPISEITDWSNGYIHANASAGIIADDNFRYSAPIFVKKGSKIHLSYAGGGTNTAIASVDITSSPYSYTRLVSSLEYNKMHGEIKEFEYVVPNDMYISVCGYNSYLSAYVDDNYYYSAAEKTSEVIKTIAGQNYSVPFKIKKGHRYLVKNSGNYDTSFVTRYAEDSPIIDTIKSEQIKDQVLNYSLLKNSWAIFVASDDANYITGWCSNVTTVSIEDITDRNVQYYSTTPNVVFQSREARVSSIYYPNQTKYGILEAAKNQYDRVRFTVRKTTDGYYFLCHNATINALAKNPDGSDISEQVSSTGKTLAELNAYDWGIQYGQKYAGMNVPLLDDALHYASLCNLAVTIEVSFAETEDDVTNMMALCTKYGLINRLIIIKSRYFATYPYYQAISPKISFFWDGTEAQFDSEIGTIRQLKSGENQIYIMCAPIGDAPSTNFLAKIVKEGFIPYYSLIFNEDQFKYALGQGFGLIESANVPFVKDLARGYVETLI